MSGPDNADFAGPWMLLYWPREVWDRNHIRVSHPVRNLTVIELTDDGSPWSAAEWSFGPQGRTLALTLVRGTGQETIKGVFDMATGVWTPEGGGPSFSAPQWHSTYAGNAAPDGWPTAPT